MATPKIRPAGADPNVTIGTMSEHDLLEVVEIEELSGLSPWGWEAYHKELQSADDVIMLVASRRRSSVSLARARAIPGMTGRRRRYYRMPVEDALIMSITFK